MQRRKRPDGLRLQKTTSSKQRNQYISSIASHGAQGTAAATATPPRHRPSGSGRSGATYRSRHEAKTSGRQRPSALALDTSNAAPAPVPMAGQDSGADHFDMPALQADFSPKLPTGAMGGLSIVVTPEAEPQSGGMVPDSDVSIRPADFRQGQDGIQPLSLAQPQIGHALPPAGLKSGGLAERRASRSSVGKHRRTPSLEISTQGIGTTSKPPEGGGVGVSGFSVSESGTFKGGDFAINREGITVETGSNVADGRRSRNKSRNSSRGSHSSLSNAQRREDDEDPEQIALKDLEMLDVIGAGANGVVKRVRHKRTGRCMAMKRIPVDVRLQKQIMIELQTLFSATSPQIVDFCGCFYTDGSIHVILEYMDAGSLGTLLRFGGKMAENILARITHEVLLGLLYLHKDQRIIHRDIKPSNLLMSQNGAVKLADFGVSSQLASSLGKAVSWVGTVTYMSPERVVGGKYSYDSDIWSLGLIVYEAATGAFPYPPPGAPKLVTFMDLMDYICENPVPVLPEKGYSKELRSFVASCLNKTPEKRASASQLLKHPFVKGAMSRCSDAAIQAWIQKCLAKQRGTKVVMDRGARGSDDIHGTVEQNPEDPFGLSEV